VGEAPLSAGAMGIWIPRFVQRRSRKAGAGADCWGDIRGRYGDFALEGRGSEATVIGNRGEGRQIAELTSTHW